MKFFEKAFDHSSLEADLVGPQIRKPSFMNSSTIPRASGSSGRARVRSIFSFFTNSISFGMSVAFIDTFIPIFKVPAFPGAKNISPTFGDCFSFQPMACSRPPLPIIKIFCLFMFITKFF